MKILCMRTTANDKLQDKLVGFIHHVMRSNLGQVLAKQYAEQTTKYSAKSSCGLMFFTYVC